MVWFGMVCFFVFQLVKVVLVSICTKFELSMCLVCPTIDINMRIEQPQNDGFFLLLLNSVRSRTLAILCMVSVENYAQGMLDQQCWPQRNWTKLVGAPLNSLTNIHLER